MNEYYDITPLDETKANYRVMIGARQDGKSYQVKKRMIENFFINKKEFALLRRRANEIQTSLMQTYFADMEEVLDGYCRQYYPKYEGYFLQARSGKFTLYGIPDLVYPKDKEEIGVMGYYFSLIQSMQAKSAAFPNVSIITYEEFIPLPGTGGELNNEFSLFINFVSTIKRNREDMVIYLCANTVNRDSSLLEGMNINIRDLIQGEIKYYIYFGENNETNTVAVEYLRKYAHSSKSESYYIFGNQREKMITKGEWETDDYAKYTDEEFYNTRLKNRAIVLDAKGFRLYVYEGNNRTLYVSTTRRGKRFTYTTLTTCQNTRLDRLTLNVVNTPQGQRIIHKILQYYHHGWIKYDDNLTGFDFESFLKQAIIHKL